MIFCAFLALPRCLNRLKSHKLEYFFKLWWVSFQTRIQWCFLFRCLYWFIWVQFTSRLFFQTKNQSLIWKKWDILGHMVWMLCINTSTVVWITPTSPNMSCNPSGLASLLSFPYGCRKFKPGFLFHLWVLCMTTIQNKFVVFVTH